jgi:carbonyl reductase 1
MHAPRVFRVLFVAGANSGIGLALCKQLCKDHGMKVFLGSRNAEKGKQAVADVKSFCGHNNKQDDGDDVVELVVIDVANDESVNAAAKSLQEKGVTLSAIVNNAGTGLAHGVTDSDVINVNLYGPKRVVDAFAPLLDPTGSKIINTGSGAGPMYVDSQTSSKRKKTLCNPDITWEEIDAMAKAGCSPDDPVNSSGWIGIGPYGLSKALLYCYTMYTARTMADKNVISLCLTPGFIATKIVPSDMHSNAKPVEEGTVSLKHCLFNTTMENNGWFYGSDAKRSPPHVLRNPGEPVFDGNLPEL